MLPYPTCGRTDLGTLVRIRMLHCQLEKIFGLISKSNRTMAEAGPRLDRVKKRQSTWAQYLGSMFRPIFRIGALGLLPAKRPRRVYFWLDIYCIPCHSDVLRDMALTRMGMTYSWANYVLVLDAKLMKAGERQDFDEFISRVSVSGWNSRFWTYEEFCMGRALVFAGDGTITLTQNIGVVGQLGFLLSGSRRTHDVDETTGRYKDLSKPLFRPTFATGARNDGNNSYDGQLRATNFAQIWNVLKDKNATKHRDMLLVFSLLLDLSPAELKHLGTGDWMKAIANTFSFLPLDLRYVDSPQVSNGWAPPLPQTGPDICDFRSGKMELTSAGLKIDLSSLAPSLNVIRVFHPGQASFSAHSRQFRDTYYIQLQQGENDLIRDAEEILLLLNGAQTASSSATRKQGNGACLLPSASAKGLLHTSYVCTISWVLGGQGETFGDCDQKSFDAEYFYFGSDVVVNRGKISSCAPNVLCR